MQITAPVNSTSSRRFICAHKHSQGVSVEGVRTSLSTESTERSVVAKSRGVVSEQRMPLTKEHTVENVYSNQGRQTRVDSGRTAQASERARKETDVYEQATHSAQL